MLVYTRNALLLLRNQHKFILKNTGHGLVSSQLSKHVWERLKFLNIQSRRRGQRGGNHRRTIYNQPIDVANISTERNINIHWNSVNFGNLINIPIDSSNSTAVLPRVNFAVWNAQSFNKKSSLLCDVIQSNRLDILAVTETWLAKDNNTALGDFLNSMTDYTFHHTPRLTGKGGGVGVFFRKQFTITTNQQLLFYII